MSRYGIIEVTPDELKQLVSDWYDRKNVEYGLFFCKESNDLYLGADNQIGDMWVEKFKTSESCMNWLKEKCKYEA